MADYSFRNVAADYGWKNYLFFNDSINDELAVRDDISLAIKINNCLQLGLYNLSHPERESMETYIWDSVAAGIIRPSSSPVGAFFLCIQERPFPAPLY